jgi:hypothetical protein
MEISHKSFNFFLLIVFIVITAIFSFIAVLFPNYMPIKDLIAIGIYLLGILILSYRKDLKILFKKTN